MADAARTVDAQAESASAIYYKPIRQMPHPTFFQSRIFGRLNQSPRVAPVLIMLACGLPQALLAAELHVSPAGNDNNPGTREAPFKTPAAARDAARKLARQEPVTVTLADGIYYLPETLTFTPADSGTAQHPVIYQAMHEGKAVISGGLRLDLQWKPDVSGTFIASTPPGLAIDQLFIDGRRQHMARYPNFDAAKTTVAYQGCAADAFSKERAARWADPAGGYIHAMHVARWGGYEYRITGKKPDGEVEYEGGWQNNRQMGMHPEFRMVENIFEELDAPGEWFHNTKTNTLYFNPETGTDLTKAVVEVVRLRHLVEFRGTPGQAVKHIRLKGFTYRHAARTFMDTKEPLLRSDWTIYRGGAVFLTGTEDIGILDSEFDQPGGNAIFVSNYNRRVLIKGCHIHDVGASGVCFVGDPAAVRDPLFEYAQVNDLTRIDRTPGPKTENYPADCSVEDSLIHGIGRVERQPAGVQISMAYKISVKDTSIYDCARSGINISEGTWGGHVIERCDVFETVLETHDHGSFNSWGRDRFWSRNHRGDSEPEIKKDPKLPYLDVIATNIIRDSRWRCDHGWDIDLDDGSSNYEIYNNLMLHGGLKFREGYGRKAYNNILVNNGFHPHVWFDESASAFYQNIVMKPHAPIGQPGGWGKLVDRNLFISESHRTKHLNSGADANSLAGDPMFLNPAAGDFRVKAESPALKLGFKNFPMDQFGVKKPLLKSIAKTPAIPPLESAVSPVGQPEPARKQFWLGAEIRGIQGEEFSAFGVSRDAGGVQIIAVPENSAAARAGFKANDLVQAIQGRTVSNTAQLHAALIAAGEAPLKVRVIRNQQPQEIAPVSIPLVVAESSDEAGGFSKLAVPASRPEVVASNPATDNEPLAVLTDGKIAKNYGPVMRNGVRNGAYKMDLGASKPVTTISSWSFNQNGNRSRQVVTLYGSNSGSDPGWNLSDAAKFTPLATLDTTSLPAAGFVGSSLHCPTGTSLGPFRWIVWETNPVSEAGENTAFQELSVKTVP